MDQQISNKLGNLLIASRQGDNHAYKVFLREVSDLVRRYLQIRMKSDLAIDDILQESLIAIHKGRHTYIKGRPIEPWIFAICRNRMIDYFRKAKRISINETLTAEFADLPDESTQLPDAVSERSERLCSALTLLPNKQRQIVQYLKLEDLSIKEIAELTGMSE